MEQNHRMSSPAKRVPLLIALVVAAVFAHAAVPGPDAARIRVLAERLPERPGTPGVSPADRVHWNRLAATPEGRSIIENAERVLTAPIPELPDALYLEFAKGDGNRSRYEERYFARRARLDGLMLAEALEGKGRFLEGIVRLVESILEEKSWTVPAHDRKLDCFEGRRPLVKLFSTQRAWTLAYVVDWFGERLPAPLVERIRRECRRRIIEPHLVACRNPDKVDALEEEWFFGTGNWAAVCHAGCVGTALILVPDRMERAEILEGAERAMPFFLGGFTPDGYCSEGMSYWNYGFGNYVALVRLAMRATDGFVTFGAETSHAARIAAYGHAYQLEPGLSPLFADGGGNLPLLLAAQVAEMWPAAMPARAKDCPILCGNMINYESKEFPTPSGPVANCAAVDSRSFTLKAFGETGPKGEALPPTTRFDDAQVWFMRGTGTRALSIAVKGGHNAEKHNHNDVGSYCLAQNGVILAGDVGREPYTRRTFSSRRYESDVLNSFGHPVPRIGGTLQKTGRSYGARVLSTRFSTDGDEVTIDLAGAYACPTLVSAVRTVRLDRTANVVVIRDRIVFSRPTALDVPFTTYATRERTADGWILSRETGKVRMSAVVTGGDWNWKVDELDNSKPDKPHRVAVAFKAPVTEAEIAFRFEAMP